MRHRGGSGGSVPSLLAALAFLLLIPGCGSMEEPRTCGTDYPDPTEDLVGCLVDEEDIPVAGVTVKAIRIQAAAKPASGGLAITVAVQADTVVSVSNRMGRYSFKELEEVDYTITATDTLGRALRPVKWKRESGSRGFRASDTLFRTGIIRASLMDTALGLPVAYASCYVPGKSPVYRSDSLGGLDLPMPPGTYTLRCDIGTVLLGAVAGIEVRASDTTRVDVAMAKMEAARPPPPSTAAARYDSVTGIVHLSWPKVKYNSMIIYWVKRIDATMPQPDPVFFTQDTFYSDVVHWPRSETGGTQALSKRIVYNVGTTLATDYALSKTWVELRMDLSPPHFLGPEVSVKSASGSPECVVGDTAVLVGTFRNIYRVNRRLVWIAEGSGVELKPPRLLADSAGTDTLYYPCAAPGHASLRLTVTDEGGAAGSGYFSLDIKTP